MRSDVQLVREVLEGALPPAVATAALFEALETWGGDPRGLEQTIAFVRGPLAASIVERVGAQDAGALVGRIEARLGAQPTTSDVDVEVELAEEEDDQLTTQMAAVPHPVSVLVVSSSDLFARRLLTVLGEDRVYPHTVADEAAFRHATFSALPLIAVVDTIHPPAIRPPALAAALRGLPKQTVAVVWACETDYGREARVRIGQSDGDVVFLDRKEGIEPFLDLVLSRFKRLSTTPPPA